MISRPRKTDEHACTRRPIFCAFARPRWLRPSGPRGPGPLELSNEIIVGPLRHRLAPIFTAPRKRSININTGPEQRLKPSPTIALPLIPPLCAEDEIGLLRDRFVTSTVSTILAEFCPPLGEILLKSLLHEV